MWLRLFLGVLLAAVIVSGFLVLRNSNRQTVVALAPNTNAPVQTNQPYLFTPIAEAPPMPEPMATNPAPAQPMPEQNLSPPQFFAPPTATPEKSSEPDSAVQPEPKVSPIEKPQASQDAQPEQKIAITPAPKQEETTVKKEEPLAAKPQKPSNDSFKKGKLILGRNIPVNGFHRGEPIMVLVDKGSHFTYVLQKQKGNHVVKVFSASNAIGTEDSPTPLGTFWVANKTKWPSWVPPKSIDPKQKAVHPYNKDRKNPLGVARIRLNKWDIALHGTNNPRSIRQNASHGCIRHSNKDILTIFNMVKVGTPVRLIKNFRGTTISTDDFDRHG